MNYYITPVYFDAPGEDETKCRVRFLASDRLKLEIVNYPKDWDAYYIDIMTASPPAGYRPAERMVHKYWSSECLPYGYDGELITEYPDGTDIYPETIPERITEIDLQAMIDKTPHILEAMYIVVGGYRKFLGKHYYTVPVVLELKDVYNAPVLKLQTPQIVLQSGHEILIDKSVGAPDGVNDVKVKWEDNISGGSTWQKLYIHGYNVVLEAKHAVNGWGGNVIAQANVTYTPGQNYSFCFTNVATDLGEDYDELRVRINAYADNNVSDDLTAVYAEPAPHTVAVEEYDPDHTYYVSSDPSRPTEVVALTAKLYDQYGKIMETLSENFLWSYTGDGLTGHQLAVLAENDKQANITIENGADIGLFEVTLAYPGAQQTWMMYIDVPEGVV